MKNSSGFAAGVAAVVVLSLVGCAGNLDTQVSAKNLVRAGDPNVVRKVGDADHEFTIFGRQAVVDGLANKEIAAINTENAQAFLSRVADPSVTAPRSTSSPAESLLLGFPIGLLGQQNVFGGVITEVSAHENDSLGRLKLTDLSPLHVKTVAAQVAPGEFAVVLLGCVSECTEASPQIPLIGLPIVGVLEDQNLVIVDLAPLGSGLNLISMLDPQGLYTRLKTRKSTTTLFDYSLSTLVFDVKAEMIPLNANPKDPNVPVTTFTTRWYLKLTSEFNPAFTVRAPRQEVGYFTTQRSAETRITRFSMSSYGRAPVHYYLKNIPAEHKKAFAGAFDEWNAKMKEVLGRDLLSYEFVDPTDPRAALLVTGDVRFNILEWDLVNKAPYGGLGPSIANQFTGEIFSANVLVQGPTIIELYSTWFKAAEKASALRDAGDESAAQQVLLQAKRFLESRVQELEAPRFSLSLGESLAFRVTSQIPSLEDPIIEKLQFDELPEGYSFETYMEGYFHDLVAHELGHNLGLRHNFRGNLGAGDEKKLGAVSRSIMEYLGRLHRYLDRIGEYDVMAIAYGYAGKAPSHANWFCTDEDVAELGQPANSAECSRDDAENDPYSYFVSRLERAVDLLIARNEKSAPVWKLSDMARELPAAVNGLALYAATAKMTGSSWTNFFDQPGRPRDVDQVKQYVLEDFRKSVCDPSFEGVLALKETDEARAATRANIEALRARVIQLLAPYNLLGAEDLRCEHVPLLM